MTKVKVNNKRFQVIRVSANQEVCSKCYFNNRICPNSDEWPYDPLCADYGDENKWAYFKRID